MIPKEAIEEVILYLYREAKGYARLGALGEPWGLVHGAKALEKILKTDTTKWKLKRLSNGIEGK